MKGLALSGLCIMLALPMVLAQHSPCTICPWTLRTPWNYFYWSSTYPSISCSATSDWAANGELSPNACAFVRDNASFLTQCGCNTLAPTISPRPTPTPSASPSSSPTSTPTVSAKPSASPSSSPTCTEPINWVPVAGHEWTRLGSTVFSTKSDESEALALSGDGRTAVVVEQVQDGQYWYGQPRVLRFDGIEWTPLGNALDLLLDYTGDYYMNVDLSHNGETVVIGTYFEGGHVYRWLDEEWKLLGDSFVDVDEGYEFTGISGDGNVVLFGDQTRSNDSEEYENYSYFRYNGTSWELIPNPIVEGAWRGGGLSGDGTIMAAHSSYPGKVYKYENEGWVQLGSDMDIDLGIEMAMSDDGKTVVDLGREPECTGVDYDNLTDLRTLYVYRYFEVEADWSLIGVIPVQNQYSYADYAQISISGNGNTIAYVGFVFDYNETADEWNEVGNFTEVGEVAAMSLSLDGDTILMDTNEGGTVWAYHRSSLFPSISPTSTAPTANPEPPTSPMMTPTMDPSEAPTTNPPVRPTSTIFTLLSDYFQVIVNWILSWFGDYL